MKIRVTGAGKHRKGEITRIREDGIDYRSWHNAGTRFIGMESIGLVHVVRNPRIAKPEIPVEWSD